MAATAKVVLPKQGPPAPGKKSPGPIVKPKFSARDPRNPNFNVGLTKITAQSGPTPTNPPYSRDPNDPNFTRGITQIQAQPNGPYVGKLPQKVSGSVQVGPKIIKAFGPQKTTTKPLPPTTDKVKRTPVALPQTTDPSQYGTTLPPTQTLPGLPGAATYSPVAAPPLYRAVGTPNLDPYAGQTAAQAAQAQLDPQYAALDSQSAANQASLRSFTQSILDALKGIPAQTGQDYTQAQNVTEGLANKAQQLLSGANPNGADQSILQAINAPGSQQAGIADQLQKTFGGGGAVLYDQNGANAGSALAAQKAAALSYANAQPGIQGLAATQAERNLLYQDAQQKATIAAQFPTLENQVSAAKANALYNEAQFTAAQRGAVNTSAANRSSFTAGQNATVASNALARAGYNQNNAALGIKTTAAEEKTLPTPNTSWTRVNGYRSDQYGNPILVNGKPVFNPGYKLNAAGTGAVKVGTGAGKPITSSEAKRLYEGVSNMQAGFTDAKGKVHPALDYNAALAELRREGYFRNPTLTAEARKALNTAYGKPVTINFGNGTSTTTVPGNPALP